MRKVLGGRLYVSFQSKQPIEGEVSYFSAGGYTIDAEVGGKPFAFCFDFTRGHIDYDEEDGRTVVNVEARDMDMEFIEDSLQYYAEEAKLTKEELDQVDWVEIFRSITTKTLSEAWFIWDWQKPDGTLIEETDQDKFELTQFHLNVGYLDGDGNEQIEELAVPQHLLDAYNQKQQQFWENYRKENNLSGRVV